MVERVPWRVDGSQAQQAERDRFSGSELTVWERRTRPIREEVRGVVALREPEATADIVVVDVCLEHGHQASIFRRKDSLEPFYIALWIDHNNFSTNGDDVGVIPKARRLDLIDEYSGRWSGTIDSHRPSLYGVEPVGFARFKHQRKGALVTTVAVRATGLTKTYGEGETEVHALTDITFEIPRGEFVVLQGASGSGKTTLLNQIGALEAPTAGEVEANGYMLNGLDDDAHTEYRLNSVGFVFQFYNLVPSLTAYENVALIAELTGGDVQERSEAVLESVGLADRMTHFPGQLSGGEQQRVSIARGLVKNPPLLLCDEPTGALDTETGIQVLELLRSITDTGDRTIVVVTHSSAIAQIANRVIDLKDGGITGTELNASLLHPQGVGW